MWKFQNLNQLAPISIEMLKCWGSITNTEFVTCKYNAIHARFEAKAHFLSEAWSWEMRLFAPKYLCHEHGMIRVKLDLNTGPEHLYNHTSIMWN